MPRNTNDQENQLIDANQSNLPDQFDLYRDMSDANTLQEFTDKYQMIEVR